MRALPIMLDLGGVQAFELAPGEGRNDENRDAARRDENLPSRPERFGQYDGGHRDMQRIKKSGGASWRARRLQPRHGISERVPACEKRINAEKQTRLDEVLGDHAGETR